MKIPAALALIPTLLMSIATPAATAATSSNASAELGRLLDDDLVAVYRRNPLGATVRGKPGYNDKLPEVSLASLKAERERERAALTRLKAIDSASLKGQDRVSYELLFEKIETAVEGQRFSDAATGPLRFRLATRQVW